MSRQFSDRKTLAVIEYNKVREFLYMDANKKG